MAYALIVGNPVDGFDVHGPFDSSSDAIDYAETELDSTTEWWQVEMIGPAPEPDLSKIPPAPEHAPDWED